MGKNYVSESDTEETGSEDEETSWIEEDEVESDWDGKEYVEEEDKDDDDEDDSDIYGHWNRSEDDEEQDNDYEEGGYEGDDFVVPDQEGSDGGVDCSYWLDSDDD
jgi:hypothetical protein